MNPCALLPPRSPPVVKLWFLNRGLPAAAAAENESTPVPQVADLAGAAAALGATVAARSGRRGARGGACGPEAAAPRAEARGEGVGSAAEGRAWRGRNNRAVDTRTDFRYQLKLASSCQCCPCAVFTARWILN